MIGTLFEVLAAGLGLWQSKEKRKYLDEYIKLKTEYFHEFNKPDSEIDDNVISDIEFRLRLLGRSFASSVGVQDNQNK